jgi:sulfur-oxidizing protein SoxX
MPSYSQRTEIFWVIGSAAQRWLRVDEAFSLTMIPSIANGGNCYACHQLAPTEVAYGTLGPSLTQYGLRGQSEAMLRYTWTKLWDTHAFNLCSHMPRFGAQKILTEQQLKDVMAFLLDPNSSVNQPAEGPSSAH